MWDNNNCRWKSIILIDVVCDATTGVLITFKFRCDNTLNIRGHNSDLSPLHNRCIHLLKKPCLAGLWRECFHDNLFTSIKLALYALYEAQIKCTGVMRSGRGFPVEALARVWISSQITQSMFWTAWPRQGWRPYKGRSRRARATCCCIATFNVSIAPCGVAWLT